jgi:hypothetical protein
MNLEDIFTIVNSPTGVAALALVILWAGARGVWVYGRVHRESVEREHSRANEWKDVALGTTHLARESVELLERRRKDGGRSR